MDEVVFKSRFRHAVIICISVVAVVVLACFIRGEVLSKDSFQSQQGALAATGSSTYVQSVWEKLRSGMDGQQALSELGFDVVGRQDDEFPSWFEEEISSLAPDAKLIMDPDGALVCFEMVGSQIDVCADLDSQLEQRGWMKVDLDKPGEGGSDAPGTISSSTYIKERGELRWLMLSTIQVGEEVGVTLHIQHA